MSNNLRIVPLPLKDRLSDWEDNPPKWQHQAYGPLNAYFTALFPSTDFLVKPQSLLRNEADRVIKSGSGKSSRPGPKRVQASMDVDSDDDSDWSIDSRGTWSLDTMLVPWQRPKISRI